MKLTELDNKDTSMSAKALGETYSMPFDTAKMNAVETKTMLKKVRGLISETKQSRDFYQKQTSPAYMKLVFMEQALVDYLQLLATKPRPRIVVENEEVEKSQVVLAAQDLIDSVQKMLEDVSDMVVKELPALVNGIQSEIGVNESEQFNQQAGEALNGLQSALTQTKGTLQTALNGITGQGGAEAAFGADAAPPVGGEMPADMGGEMPADMGGEMPADMGGEMPAPEVPAEEPEAPEPEAAVGRAKR